MGATRNLQEKGQLFDEPEGSGRGKNPWFNRMKWKPEAGDTEIPPGTEVTADELLDAPDVEAGPEVKDVKPVGQKPGGGGSRFNWTPTGQAATSQVGPMKLGKEMTGQDIDMILQMIRDEQALPPHKQNAARLSQLKAEALRMMGQEESLKIQRAADCLIPAVTG